MKIAEFEKQTGLSRDTLRYYEKIGMLTPPVRAGNGYRYYGQTQLQELAFIERGKTIGFTLTEIKVGYERYQALGSLCPEFSKQLRDKKALLAKRISQDRNAIAVIDNMLKSFCS
ncbi:MAG: MerR family transcriptional regulator [Pseudoalteromonas prydzensis]|uniref:MerR family transcriptional regulator n=1 Tax=Pseudoalteromonas prydzensis TaxID=182141 RepID=A0ABR9FHG7_9GAMM|nr:MerR family transcriptional regulator [Pseudoalteromonas prydzensis]MBE0456262.1 MerR family transcriptional regulator [Pseudoalteromonas prydzensis]